MIDTITMTQSALDHRLEMARQDGYQKGLYDGLIEAHKNSDGRIAAPAKRMVAQAHIVDGSVKAAAICPETYDETLYYFLQGTGRL